MSCKFKQNNGLFCGAIQGYCQFQVDGYDGPKCPIYQAFKNLTIPTPPSAEISSVDNIIMADTTDSTISCTFQTINLNLIFN